LLPVRFGSFASKDALLPVRFGSTGGGSLNLKSGSDERSSEGLGGGEGFLGGVGLDPTRGGIRSCEDLNLGLVAGGGGSGFP